MLRRVTQVPDRLCATDGVLPWITFHHQVVADCQRLPRPAHALHQRYRPNASALKRLGEPLDIARAALFLASDD